MTSAAHILDRLSETYFAEPAHVMLHEVRAGVGFGRGVERYADALVASVHPSRGLWLAGVEAKISKSDWKRELADLEKAHAIQRYCDFWWIATPEGLIEMHELPEAWGLLEVGEKKVGVVKKAPKLSPEPLSLSFVASIVRNVRQREKVARGAGRNDAWREAQSSVDQTRVDELKNKLFAANDELRTLKARVELLERDKASLTSTQRLFEEQTGLSVTEGRFGNRIGEAVQFVRRLAEIEALPELLRKSADQIETMGAAARGPEQKSA